MISFKNIKNSKNFKSGKSLGVDGTRKEVGAEL
jgi:hypothetical protein